MLLYQKGVALIFLAFILGLGATAYLLKKFSVEKLQANQDQKTYKVLGEAKQTLIAWSVSNKYTPGQMPWPDRNGDGNYDGSSDCVATTFQYSYLLGQLPTQPATSPCLDPNTGSVVYTGLSTYPGLGEDLRDAQGNKLWYAVSRNLVRDYETATNPVINSGIANSPTYPWLQVLDRNGSLVSNRVAVVIIAPGDPIGGQSRGGAANASEYLDSFQIGAATFNNRGYATPDEDFIMGEDSRNVSVNDTSLNKPYYFNDKLVYITIDELMAALEKRVGEEVRADLKAYADTNSGNYPFAAVLGGVGPTLSRKYRCTTNNIYGNLPLDNPADTCTYTSTGLSVNSVCSFQDITSIEFRKSSPGNFTSNTPSCTRSGRICNCTGAGSCSVGATTFTCDAAGNCNGNVPGRIRFLGAGFTLTSNSAVCSLGTLATCPISPTQTDTVSRTVTCNGLSLPVTLTYSCSDRLTSLPAWLYTNRWQDYVFYEMTRPTNMTGIKVGTKDAGAVIITTGTSINSLPFATKGSAQIRPSCGIKDYLDSTENTNGDVNFEATSKLKATNYNDQTFIVAP